MAKYSKSRTEIFASGTALFETRLVTHNEFEAYRVLISQSRDIVIKAVDAAKRLQGLSSPDLLLAGKRWELKCPTGNNSRKTIGRNINKAIAQMQNTGELNSVCIVLSSLATPIAKNIVEAQIKKKLNEGRIDYLIAIYTELRVVYYHYDKKEQKITEIPIALL